MLRTSLSWDGGLSLRHFMRRQFNLRSFNTSFIEGASYTPGAQDKIPKDKRDLKEKQCKCCRPWPGQCSGNLGERAKITPSSTFGEGAKAIGKPEVQC